MIDRSYYSSRQHYQYLLDENKWVEVNDFSDELETSNGKLTAIYEIENEIYLIGLYGISTLNSEVYKFPQDDYYEVKTSCRIGNNLLVVREYGEESFIAIDFKLLDTESKQVSDILVETDRTNFTAVEFLNHLWIISQKGILVYDPVNKIQYLSPVEMVQARRDSKVIVYKNKLFVFGGRSNDALKTFNSVEMYSTDTNKFVLMAPMKISRYSFGCCRVGNLVYVIGGYNKDDPTKKRRFLKSVEIYNLDTDTWSDGDDLPEAKDNLHACTVTNKLQ